MAAANAIERSNLLLLEVLYIVYLQIGHKIVTSLRVTVTVPAVTVTR